MKKLILIVCFIFISCSTGKNYSGSFFTRDYNSSIDTVDSALDDINQSLKYINAFVRVVEAEDLDLTEKDIDLICKFLRVTTLNGDEFQWYTYIHHPDSNPYLIYRLPYREFVIRLKTTIILTDSLLNIPAETHLTFKGRTLQEAMNKYLRFYKHRKDYRFQKEK